MNSANSKQKNACCGVKGKTDLGTEVKNLQQRWKRDGWSVFVCFKSFPPALYLCLFFLLFSPLHLRQSLSTRFLHFLHPCCKSYMQKKWSQDQQVVPAGIWFLFSFPFFSSFSSTINLPNIIVTLANERNFLYSLCFSLVFGCFFFRSFLFVFLFFFCSLCSFFFPR